MKKKVIYLRFHSTDMFLTGTGIVGQTLPGNVKNIVEMSHDSESPSYVKVVIGKVNHFIPLTSIQTGVFEDSK
jgi:hypothetical protein